jgi:hypothetical protein
MWGVAVSYFDRLHVQFKAIFCDQEFLDIFALIALELNHLAHLTIGDDGAIAGCSEKSVCVILTIKMMCYLSLTELLLDDLEDLLLIEFLREALDSSQSLTTISLCATQPLVAGTSERRGGVI